MALEVFDDIIPMKDANGTKFAMKFNPKHQQHGWIFYDNYGTWVTYAVQHRMKFQEPSILLKHANAFVYKTNLTRGVYRNENFQVQVCCG